MDYLLPEEEWITQPYIYIVFYIDNGSLNLDRDIDIYYRSDMDRDMKIKVIKIFEKSLPDNYEWKEKVMME